MLRGTLQNGYANVRKDANCGNCPLHKPPNVTAHHDLPCLGLATSYSLVPPSMAHGAGYPKLGVKGVLKSVETTFVQLGVPRRLSAATVAHSSTASSYIQTPVPASKCLLAEF